MKKNKKIWFLITFFLGLLFCFGLVMGAEKEKEAEKGPNECCKLDHDLRDIDPACTKDALVAPGNDPTEYWCDWNNDRENDIGGATVTKNWSKCCVIDAIYNVTDWLFYILLTGVALFYIVGAIYFLQASGDPNRVKQAQHFIFYGTIGLLLAFMARIIPAIVKALVA